MRLAELIEGLEVKALHGAAPEVEITGLTHDSRRAGPGVLFAALRGSAADGHDFAAAAVEAGSPALLVERPLPELGGVCQVEVADSRRALAMMASRFFGQPSRQMTCIGITGTNGKTTVSYLLESVFSRRGPVGVLGTVEYRYGEHRRPAPLTTPDAVWLQSLLAEMRAAGVKQAVMEISSHALEQHRADGVLLDAAVFTNLSRDHLDYHGDMESYFQAKLGLFQRLLPDSRRAGKPALAVAWSEDSWGSRVLARARELGLSAWSFGFDHQATVQGGEIKLTLAGSSLKVAWPGGRRRVRTSLVGRYNLLNLLAAAAVGLGLGMEPDEVFAGLAALKGVPGRLERVEGPRRHPAVFVDYAHTDDALRNVLAALKPLTPGRLICVFGAGGDRDPGKRPLMGRAVARGADLAVLTSDNPRSEDPLAIMAMIEPGLQEEGWRRVESLAGRLEGAYLAVADRAEAIAVAVESAGRDDVVLIAGKGHEDYQIIGSQRRPFDDRRQAAAALAAGGGRRGGRRAQA